jgi:hypothetical protein
MACAVAYRLTGDARYSSKALELIRRCASPADDLEALNLRHIESRWSYTVFLQVLAVFLHERLLSGSRSADDSYVRETILHYARWMARHERLYLDRVDELEFPTETWAAQDIRKADVLWWAAHLADGEERKAFQAKAAEFFERAVASLAARPTRFYTRPLVLTIVNGFRAQRLQAAVHAHDASGLWPTVAERHRTPKVFRPQKRVAFQRARVLAVTAGLGVVALALYVTGLIR